MARHAVAGRSGKAVALAALAAVAACPLQLFAGLWLSSARDPREAAPLRWRPRCGREVARGLRVAAPATAGASDAGPLPEAVRSVLLGRRTVNDFEPELPLGWEGAVRRAVEAACYAPNHRRTEPWRFHLLGPKRVRAVCELNAQLVAAKKGDEAGAKKLKRWLAMPGWLVVTQAVPEGVEADASASAPDGVLQEDYAACCCAVQNLCLSLHSEGIGTKWTTGPVNFHDGFQEAAGIPEGERVVGTIWFGTPADVPTPPKKRLSVDEVLRVSD